MRKTRTNTLCSSPPQEDYAQNQHGVVAAKVFSVKILVTWTFHLYCFCFGAHRVLWGLHQGGAVRSREAQHPTRCRASKGHLQHPKGSHHTEKCLHWWGWRCDQSSNVSISSFIVSSPWEWHCWVWFAFSSPPEWEWEWDSIPSSKWGRHRKRTNSCRMTNITS